MNTVMCGEPYQNELVVFMHMFKTGGTTLYNAMSKAEGSRYVLANPPDILKRVNKNTKMLAGHITFFSEHISILESLNTKMYTITLFRNPIDRVISDYYWIKYHDFDYKVSYRNKPLEVWLENGFSRGVNQATSFYAGKPEGEATPEEAKQNILNNITDFGILEDFDYFIRKISADLKTSIYEHLGPPAKKNPKRLSEVSDSTKAIIAKYNQKDLELYSWAKDLYEQRKKEIQ